MSSSELGKIGVSRCKLHHRLHDSLTRVYDGKEKKWQFPDTETQIHVIESIASFLDSISPKMVHNPSVEDSIADIVKALVWILENGSVDVVEMASNVVLKLITVLPDSIREPDLLDVIFSLLFLLSFEEVKPISCATALNIVFSNLSEKRKKRVWGLLVDTEGVSNVVRCIKQNSGAAFSFEYFKEMASLLSTILHNWPQSRCPVWNDAMLLEALGVIGEKPDFSVKVSVLKLCSALALCSHGANKLIENGERLLKMMVLCMGEGKCCPFSVRVEGFRLAQCLTTNETRCLKVMNLDCERIVEAIIYGMSKWSSCKSKIIDEDVTLLHEACSLAMISRYAGPHHDLFWKKRIDKVLLNILLDGLHERHYSSLNLTRTRKHLSVNLFLDLRPTVWNLLAFLATHCPEDLSADWNGFELYLDILITCACISFVDSMQRGNEIYLDDESGARIRESVSRAVLMLIYSPSEYIASKARVILSKIRKVARKESLEKLLNILKFGIPGHSFRTPNVLQTSAILTALICHSCFPEHKIQIVESGGINTLIKLLKWCLSDDICLGNRSMGPNRHNIFGDEPCCGTSKEDRHSADLLMLYCLWGLYEFLNTSDESDILSGLAEYTEFFNTLHEICAGTYSPRTKWFAALILKHFGVYGFSCKLGLCIGNAFNTSKYADMQFLLNGESVSTHGVIIYARCPSYDGTSVRNEMNGEFDDEIRLSSDFDNRALAKLLEFVYLGFFCVEEELVEKVRILAEHFELQPLLMLLDGRIPKWGTGFPGYDLSVALTTTAGYSFSDIILEAEGSELVDWQCSTCSQVAPHVHAHKTVLSSRSDYLRTLFESGMKESNSKIIKVPTSWEALDKLVNWCYTGELPSLSTDCVWDSKNYEGKLTELLPYLELYWLADFWLLDDVRDISLKIIVSCLDRAQELCTEVIRIASFLSLWKLVEVANRSGQLGAVETLDVVVDTILAASEWLSQEENQFEDAIDLID